MTPSLIPHGFANPRGRNPKNKDRRCAICQVAESVHQQEGDFDMPRQLLKIGQVAATLSCSPYQVWVLADAGFFRVVQIGPHSARVFKDELDVYLESLTPVPPRGAK